jgi:hypothetical protein
MKTPVVAATLIGAVVGSAITYSISSQTGRSAPQSQVALHEVKNPTEIRSSFGEVEGDKEPDDYFRLLLTDPTDLIKRDMVIAMWYANEVRTVDYLRVNTGREFGPVWNQRSPVEILEEQLEFWKEYLGESRRLEELQRTKRKEAQAAPPAGERPAN